MGSLYDVTSCLAAWSHVPSRGVSIPGPMFLPGGSLCVESLSRGSLPRGICDQGISMKGGVSVKGERDPPK